MALNEERYDFAVTKWDPQSDMPEGQIIKQTWFAGCHSDVGGGWIEGDLADIALIWMIAQATTTSALRFDTDWALRVPHPVKPWGTLVPHNDLYQTFPFALARSAVRKADFTGAAGAWDFSRAD